MSIQHKLVVTSILTLCMLTISFLLSSLTVLQNGQGSQLAASALPQNNASALLIESMPESCENNHSSKSETCLRLNTTSRVDTPDDFSANATTVTIIIPEPASTTEASTPIVTTVLKRNNKQISQTSADPLEKASLLACEMATRQYGLNGVCVELYRDNGDAIVNPNEDQFIGFSLIMDDSTSNPDHYQFTNLLPGTYFATLYAMTDLPVTSNTVEESVESDMMAESESHTLIRASAIDEVSQERN